MKLIHYTNIVIIGIMIACFYLWGFIQGVVVGTILFTIYGIVYLYLNPEPLVALQSLVNARTMNDPPNEKWYARLIRKLSSPIYWYVDKAIKRWEEMEDE